MHGAAAHRAVGACVGTLLAWWLPASWRLLTFLAGLFCLAYVPTWSLVVESPQWLLLHSKKVNGGLGREGLAELLGLVQLLRLLTPQRALPLELQQLPGMKRGRSHGVAPNCCRRCDPGHGFCCLALERCRAMQPPLWQPWLSPMAAARRSTRWPTPRHCWATRRLAGACRVECAHTLAGASVRMNCQ